MLSNTAITCDITARYQANEIKILEFDIVIAEKSTTEVCGGRNAVQNLSGMRSESITRLWSQRTIWGSPFDKQQFSWKD